MSIEKDDIRAAVAAGMITEIQATSLIGLSQTRQGLRKDIPQTDEPFVLFQGFNEIFIIVGLAILYAGWAGFTAVSIFDTGQTISNSVAIFGAIGAVIIAILTHYFSTVRRMVGPSIALSILFGLNAIQIGTGFSLMGSLLAPNITLAAGIATALVALYWYWFRIPFAIATVAIGVFIFCLSLFIDGLDDLEKLQNLFLLSAEGPFALITIGLGIVGFLIAMRFDMSDPYRLTRRSSNGFWLHIVAAPAIVNTVALTLFTNGSLTAQITLVIFLTAMAAVAIIVDRRSFLIAGVGYVVALSATVLDDAGAVSVLLLGVLLLILGARWERIRSRLMNSIPNFPGKSKMPPWSVTPQGAAND